jgi:hypothetical protein
MAGEHTRNCKPRPRGRQRRRLLASLVLLYATLEQRCYAFCPVHASARVRHFAVIAGSSTSRNGDVNSKSQRPATATSPPSTSPSPLELAELELELELLGSSLSTLNPPPVPTASVPGLPSTAARPQPDELPFDFTLLGQEIAFPCTIRLVPRSEGRSLVYINGTEASQASSSAGALRAATAGGIRLIGELTISRPAYLRAVEGHSGAHTLCITQFGLARPGSIAHVDLNPAHSSGLGAVRSKPRLKRRMAGGPLTWPNEVNRVPAAQLRPTVKPPAWDALDTDDDDDTAAAAGEHEGAPADAALLVADGFLMPGKTDGGVYLVVPPAAGSSDKEQYVGVSGIKRGWFYHKVRQTSVI